MANATGASLSLLGIEMTRPPTEAALLPEPTERDGDRTEESCQQDSRKHENLQRNLVPDHVPFLHMTNCIFQPLNAQPKFRFHLVCFVELIG
jgi:hypothetical protein